MKKSFLLLLTSSLLLLVFLFFWFHPTIPLMSDESEYLRNAYLLTQGITGYSDEEFAYGFVGSDDRFFSRYPLTASIFIVPFLVGGLNTIFLFGLFFFLLGFFFFYKLLQENKLSPWWSFLYFGYLPFLYHATTLMMDLPSMALVLGAFYFYVKKKHGFCGIFLGLATLVKSTNFLAAIVIGVFILINIVKKKEKVCSLLKLVLGTVPFLIILLLHNWHVYGDFLGSGYFFIHNNFQFLFGHENASGLYFGNLFRYFLFLNVFYPGMLILAFLSKYSLRKEAIAYALLSLLFFSSVNAIVKLDPLNLISMYRFIFPIIPLLFIGYAHFFEQSVFSRFKKMKKHFGKIMLLCCVLSLVAFVPLFDLKSQGSSRSEKIITDIYANTVNDSLIIGVQEGNYFSELFGVRGYVGILRPVGFENGELVAENKTIEYLKNGKKVYVLYLDTPNYSYKSGISETKAVLDNIRNEHGSNLVYEKSYMIGNIFYNSEISVQLFELG
ncbi:hypothetical protein COV18_02065 [Candidatus Woesearchaeota archaeon CG10_big_fil_rev_8_21_14_0_10_37_12]|nr:MAG: hypothetical protein COV18_02065 [Candidatus Woesearchaeota archaeon CG10_big_fil_rev_8_21_14_0_10_37_12]